MFGIKTISIQLVSIVYYFGIRLNSKKQFVDELQLVDVWCTMFRNGVVLCLALLACLTSANGAKRSFVIDWTNNQFLKDGKPFRYMAGTMHYFRVPAGLWRDRFQKMKYGGLNAVQR